MRWRARFTAKGQYRRAHAILSEGGLAGLAVGQFHDGGFESDIAPPGRALFGWNVTQSAGQVVIDARTAHGGRRSLRVAFNASGQVDFRNVWQTIAVEPGARYRVSFFVKTEELRSAATLASGGLGAGHAGHAARLVGARAAGHTATGSRSPSSSRRGRRRRPCSSD